MAQLAPATTGLRVGILGVHSSYKPKIHLKLMLRLAHLLPRPLAASLLLALLAGGCGKKPDGTPYGVDPAKLPEGRRKTARTTMHKQDMPKGAELEVGVPRLHLQVNTVEVSGGAVLVGGFSFLRDPHHTRSLAALDAETMEPVRSFEANADPAYGELTVAPNALYIAPTHQLGYD
ncbi:MAG: hypothetical protein EOO36_24280, partial [Cytophagaceae bacterium]